MTNNNIPNARVIAEGIDITDALVPGSVEVTTEGVNAAFDVSNNPVLAHEMEKAAEAINEFAEGLDFTGESFTKWLAEFAKDFITPREELMYRLNEGIQGRDPGEPFNQKADGWKVWA